MMLNVVQIDAHSSSTCACNMNYSKPSLYELKFLRPLSANTPFHLNLSVRAQTAMALGFGHVAALQYWGFCKTGLFQCLKGGEGRHVHFAQVPLCS